jgi:hypothetical protein
VPSNCATRSYACSVRGSPGGGGEWVKEYVRDEGFADAVAAVYDTSNTAMEDVCWIAPVTARDFKYEDSFLAGECGLDGTGICARSAVISKNFLSLILGSSRLCAAPAAYLHAMF